MRQQELRGEALSCSPDRELIQDAGTRFPMMQWSQAVGAEPSDFTTAAVGQGGAGYRWNPPADHLRFSIAKGDYAPPPPDDDSSDAGSTATNVDLVRLSPAWRT